MTYNYESSKFSRFDQLMYSDPEHLVFAYSPDTSHLRLLEIQKYVKSYQNNGEADYFQHSFHLRDQNNSQNYDNFVFIPKRCMMLDNQLAVIQKIQQGKPLNYCKKYTKYANQQLSNKIFHWYSDNEQMLLSNNSQFFKQYISYQQINTFCFGRKHFVRSLNSIQLSSDHVSRNHCQLMNKKGKTKNDMQRYFQLLFGLKLGSKKRVQNNGRKSVKLSKANKLLKVTKQLWSIIYSFIFLSKDKYYIVDNGSRNGTFFIECYDISQAKEQIQPLYQYNLYGHKIIQNHKLSIKQGYSYEFQGQEYLMKVWRLTESKNALQKIQNQSDNHKNQTFQNDSYNQKTIKYIQQFEDKINWFNNFQKVNKDYIIDENLLNKNLWKDKQVYQEMILKKVNLNEFSSQNQNIQRNIDPFQSFPTNESPITYSNQHLTKNQFVRLIYQQYILQQKILLKNSAQQVKQSKSSQTQEQFSEKQSLNMKIPQSDSNMLKDLFINQHQINTMVLSLDFSNDFKKLYCLITQANKQNKFHMGPQMMINTARFEFEQNQRCNGFIQYDGKKWNIISLSSSSSSSSKKQIQQKTKNNKQNHQRNDFSDDESDLEQITVPIKSFDKVNVSSNINNFAKKSTKIQQNQQQQQKKQYQMNLCKKLQNKIWTKIPAKSLYQLNPSKCNNYLLRLAHSFYFQLKFINFTAQKTQYSLGHD